MLQCEMIINGQPVTAATTFDVINPATEEVFAQCQQGSAEHVDQAVAAARAAFPGWSRMADSDRAEKLRALVPLLEARMPEFMELVTKESGKPMAGLNGVGSGMEVGGTMAWIGFTADLELPVDVLQDDDEARIEVHRRPLGVVGSITPWNWPLMISIWHIMPALRAGNTVVLKPSEYTPVAVSKFVELANEVLPAGVLNMVTGGGDVGAAISSHPDIAKIVFTGSIATGRRIMESAAGNLKRLTLELGGNDAGIVLPDVDVAAIAPKLFAACFHNNGQTCAALKRLYVHEDIYDEVAQAIAQQAREVVVGDGLDEATQLGPMQNQAQLNIVKSLAEDARAQGATFLTGGQEREGAGYFFEPTVVTDITDGSRLVDEEPFGPIVPIIKYSDLDEVIERANNSPNGLGGSIWSSDANKAAALAGRMECGTVWINDHAVLHPHTPFGGVKQSGFGVEFGNYGLEEFTSLQTVKIMKA
ncbi:MAG: aldehyde dehydrogenase family protein [Gammaproteobacteria bacterium]|nr:aldehyde dehydrogenase family protein [Gammaproteobacteria bacterium]